MKRWTVMLIPQDRGGTQTFSLAAYHFWTGIAVLSLLAFFSAFFFQRHQVIAAQAAFGGGPGLCFAVGDRMALLAQGLVRLRSSYTPDHRNRTSEGGFSLGFSGQQSVHSDPVNNPRTASR